MPTPSPPSALERIFDAALELFADYLERHKHKRGTHLVLRITAVEHKSRPLPHGAGTMSFTLGDDQKFTLTLGAADDAGNAVPATADLVTAPPAWDASDTSILTVTPAADGLSAEISANGPLATGIVVTVAGTMTNPPAGQSADFSFDYEIDVAATAAVGFAFIASTPTHK